MVFCPGSGGWSFPRPREFKKEPETGWYQLYNLETDPAEQHNLVAAHPDVAERLERRMRKYIDDGRSTPGAPQENDGTTTLLHPEWLRKAMGE